MAASGRDEDRSLSESEPEIQRTLTPDEFVLHHFTTGRRTYSRSSSERTRQNHRAPPVPQGVIQPAHQMSYAPGYAITPDQPEVYDNLTNFVEHHCGQEWGSYRKDRYCDWRQQMSRQWEYRQTLPGTHYRRLYTVETRVPAGQVPLVFREDQDSTYQPGARYATTETISRTDGNRTRVVEPLQRLRNPF